MTWLLDKSVSISWCRRFALHKLLSRNQSSKKNFSDTVILPKTNYKSFLDVKHERKIRSSSQFKDVYYRQHEERQSCEQFILHDGPPYANGDAHLGHAVNKILKDFIVRFKILEGKRVDFTPGWDCHGLPIEVKAIQSNSHDAVSRRKIASTFAEEAILNQSTAFQSWGVIGNWRQPYLTNKIDFVIQELKIFHDLWKKGLIYKDYLPVFWSTCFQTALAEAELEYDHHHVSPSLYFKFDVLGKEFKGFKNTSLLIWTTTPWTLPSNQAICYAPSESYSVVKLPSKEENHFIVGTARVPELTKLLPGLEILTSFPSTELDSIKYCHPMKLHDQLPLIPSILVTMTKGTGLMHTAPNHGKEDYSIAIKNGIRLGPSIVDDKGCFIDSVDLPQELRGLQVLTEGSAAVMSLLKESVVHCSSIEHSYPCDWRSKKPVIIRPSQQFFFDTESIKTDVLSAFNEVNVHPSGLKRTLGIELEKRPQWCISRQRVWGCPIPVFYDQSDIEGSKPILNEDILKSVFEAFSENGVSSWWSHPADYFLPHTLKGRNYRKSTDILDIWFDSGVSWANVLKNDSIADVYLEGHDQFRGWFQSSMITRVAAKGKPPYKHIIVHGFVLDENGRKMSKSEGNVVDPVDLVNGNKILKIDAYGSDVLRWWVFRYAAHSRNVPFSMNQMMNAQEDVRKVRTCLRFVLGSLHGFDAEKHLIHETKDLLTTDKMMVAHLQSVYKTCFSHLQSYEFESLHEFMSTLIQEDLSSIYFSAVKNRLYCSREDSIDRRSVQSVFHRIVLPMITQFLTPILPHSFTEAYKFYPSRQEDNVMLLKWQSFDDILDEGTSQKMVNLLSILKSVRRRVNQKLPSTNTKPFDVTVTFQDEKEAALVREMTSQELVDFLNVASVKIETGPVTTQDEEETQMKFSIMTDRSQRQECPRCRNFVSTDADKLCIPCQEVIS